MFLFFIVFLSFWPWQARDAEQVKPSSFEIPANPAVVRLLRVALFYEKPQVLVSSPSAYEIRGFPANQALAQGPALGSIPIRPEVSGIRVGSAVYPVTGLRITSSAKEIQVEKNVYPNAIRVLKNPAGSLTVVNEVDIEDYLKGVLPGEINSDWPEEAMKAQAVVSRTYAVFKNIENQEFPFTLSSDVASQVYGGKGLEDPRTSRAAERTKGEILTYNARIFPAFFHSTCGGGTTRADYQWRIKPHPSLKGVECSFCRGSKFFRWKTGYSVSEIEKLLAANGHRVSGIRGIEPEEVDATGRPRFFAIRHGNGNLTLSANEFRLALGPDRLRSTRLRLQKAGNRVVVEGRGWGHGVGMCQWGARRLAELGYRYTDILRYYYPESEIQNLEDLAGPAVRDPIAAPGPEEDGIFKQWYRKAKDYVEDF